MGKGLVGLVLRARVEGRLPRGVVLVREGGEGWMGVGVVVSASLFLLLDVIRCAC